MAKMTALSRTALEDAKLFGVIPDKYNNDIRLLFWDDSGELGITQGLDAVVIDKDQAVGLMRKLALFIDL